jgi:hypothetical protein
MEVITNEAPRLSNDQINDMSPDGVQPIRDTHAVRAVALPLGAQRKRLRGQLHPGLQDPPGCQIQRPDL